MFAHDSVYGGSVDQDRCYDKTILRRTERQPEWQTLPFEKTSPCQIGEQQDYYISDGVNTGGLTAEQASTFTNYLREQEGLIIVKDLRLVDHNAKQYLHFTVSLNPIKVKGTSYGAQWLMFAFKQTKLDPSTWPYTYASAGGDGLAIEYYVDPATQLPAYSEILTVPREDSENAAYGTENDFTQVSYRFGTATFDATEKNTDLLKLDW